MWKTRAYLISCIFGFLAVLDFSCDLAAQGLEFEPNQPCSSAQAFPGVTFPFTVEGELAPFPDVDFFLFQADPMGFMRVDLEGSSTAMGTLSDPFLGVFDGNCNLINLNDDGGMGVNSRLEFTVPEDGRFILGVTSCCDSEFTGGGEGSYLLTVASLEAIGSISVRVIDEEGTQLPGFSFPYASVVLMRCDEFGCQDVYWVSPDESGRFTFPGSAPVPGAPVLLAGAYAIRALATGYQEVQTDPFEVEGGEDYDYGDLVLPHIQVIGSIQGRLVDSVSGEPLRGCCPGWTSVELRRCEDWGCWLVGGQNTDEEGRFYFHGSSSQLAPGTFELWAYAEGYYPGQTERFSLGEGEDLDYGDFPLEPVPVQLELIRACSDLPSQGGPCSFTVGLRNRSGKRISGLVWSYIYAGLPESPTAFQIGGKGSENPRPEKYNLKAGASAAVQFEFDVPGTVPGGVYICTATIAGLEPNPMFNVMPEIPGFCIYKASGPGGFMVTSEKETRRVLRELRKQGRN